MAPGFVRCCGATEIVGPGGMISAEEYRFGLFLMVPEVCYPPHAREAKELYLVLSGTAAGLSVADEKVANPPGAFSHHLPWQPHATRSGASPLLAAWARHGNLDFGTLWI